MSQDDLSACMALLKEATAEKFANSLKKSVKEMEQALQKKQKETEFKVKLDGLGSKVLNNLTVKLGGCGEKCPAHRVKQEQWLTRFIVLKYIGQRG